VSTAYVTLDCENTSVTGVGDTLTINWRVRPEQCFDPDCGWNYAGELVTDNGGLQDAGLVGWWRLYPASGAGQEPRLGVRPTEADVSAELDEVLQRLRREIEVWQSRSE